MKLTLATAALVMSLSGFASAASISAAANLDLNFATNLNGTFRPLDETFIAKVGFYGGPALTTTSTFSEINAGWVEAGSINFATGAMAGYNGYFQSPGLVFTDSLGLAGKNVWVWATNGSNQNILMQAISAAAGPGFQFRADSDIPNTGDVAIKTANLAGWQVALGEFNTGGANAAYGGSYVLNNAIPEPSAALLGAFGAIGLLRRRRK